MANEKYDPKLSEAGFMDLVLALQNTMNQPDTIKLLATKPPGQVAAIRALERVAIAYVDVVEGRGEALATEGFTPGHPPESIDAAWLLICHEGADGEVNTVVLGVRYQDDWCEAGDWKAERILDSVHADGGLIVGWMPYVIPRAAIAKTSAEN